MPIVEVQGEVTQRYIPGLLSYIEHIQNLQGRYSRAWTLHFEVDLRLYGCDVGGKALTKGVLSSHICPH